MVLKKVRTIGGDSWDGPRTLGLEPRVEVARVGSACDVEFTRAEPLKEGIGVRTHHKLYNRAQAWHVFRGQK